MPVRVAVIVHTIECPVVPASYFTLAGCVINKITGLYQDTLHVSRCTKGKRSRSLEPVML